MLHRHCNHQSAVGGDLLYNRPSRYHLYNPMASMRMGWYTSFLVWLSALCLMAHSQPTCPQLKYKLVGSKTVLAGKYASLELSVTNKGGDVARDVWVEIDLPPGVYVKEAITFPKIKNVDGPIIEASTISFPLSDLPKKKTRKYKLKVEVDLCAQEYLEFQVTTYSLSSDDQLCEQDDAFRVRRLGYRLKYMPLYPSS